MKMNWKRAIALTLSLTMIALSSGRVQAGLAPAMGNEATQSVRAQDLQTVQTFLERKEVGAHLAEMGLTADETRQRLNNLSDQEIHDVATRVHQQNPGRDGAGVVVTVLVIGILVLLFVYLLKRV